MKFPTRWLRREGADRSGVPNHPSGRGVDGTHATRRLLNPREPRRHRTGGRKNLRDPRRRRADRQTNTTAQIRTLGGRERQSGQEDMANPTVANRRGGHRRGPMGLAHTAVRPHRQGRGRQSDGGSDGRVRRPRRGPAGARSNKNHDALQPKASTTAKASPGTTGSDSSSAPTRCKSTRAPTRPREPRTTS